MSTFDPSVVDVEHFLDTLGVEHISKATQNEMRFSCPYPSHTGGDETPSCYMNIESARFFCHGCKERGTAIDFAGYVLQISPLEAIRLLKSAYMPGAINPDARDMQAEVKKILAGRDDRIVQPILPKERIDDYAVDWQAAHEAMLRGEGFDPCNYFFERGFDAVTLDMWRFGWDSRSQRIVFPIYNIDSNLIGFKGRACDDRKPKYLVLGDAPSGGRYGFPRYYPSHVVFGSHRYNAGVNGPLIICEGELNAIATTQKTARAAVAINGSFFTNFHAKVIRSIAGDDGVILFLDTDKAGNECVWGREDSRGEWHPGVVELLSPHMSVLLVPDHEKDAADLDESEIEALLTQAKSSLLVRVNHR